MKNKWWMPLVIVALIIGGTFALLYSTSKPVENTATTSSSSEHVTAAAGMIGNQVPSFALKNTAGEQVDIATFNDKPMFIIFWASWCPYCQSQMPAVHELYKKYKDQVNFVMIDLIGFNNETQEMAEKYFEKNDYTFPLLMDQNQEAADLMQVEQAPTMFIVDGNQTVKNAVASVKSFDELEAEIKTVLN